MAREAKPRKTRRSAAATATTLPAAAKAKKSQPKKKGSAGAGAGAKKARSSKGGAGGKAAKRKARALSDDDDNGDAFDPTSSPAVSFSPPAETPRVAKRSREASPPRRAASPPRRAGSSGRRGGRRPARLSAASPLTGDGVLRELDRALADDGGARRGRSRRQSRSPELRSDSPSPARGRSRGGASTGELRALQAKYDRLKKLRQTDAERALEDAQAAWRKKADAQRSVIDQLKRQLEEAGGVGGAAKAARAADALRAERDALAEQLQEAQLARQVAERERDTLLAANEALTEEVERTHDTYQALTSVRAEPDDVDPDVVHCSARNRAARRHVRYDLRFTPGSEGGAAELCLVPTTNVKLLPAYLQQGARFAPDEAPRFVAKTVDALYAEA